MLLYIIRHGHPTYNAEDDLTEEGHKQAMALVPRLVQSKISRIYSSPLNRAIITGKPTANALGLDIHIEPWLSEGFAYKHFAYRDQYGKKHWIFFDNPCDFVHGKAHDAGDKWYELDAMKVMPTAKEGYEILQKNSDDFLSRIGYLRDGNEYIIKDPTDDHIAVFCHQGIGLVWFSHLMRIPPNIVWAQFDLTHTGVTVIEFKNRPTGRTVPKCLCFSDMSHLFAAEDTEYLYHSSILI